MTLQGTVCSKISKYLQEIGPATFLKPAPLSAILLSPPPAYFWSSLSAPSLLQKPLNWSLWRRWISPCSIIHHPLSFWVMLVKHRSDSHAQKAFHDTGPHQFSRPSASPSYPPVHPQGHPPDSSSSNMLTLCSAPWAPHRRSPQCHWCSGAETPATTTHTLSLNTTV